MASPSGWSSTEKDLNLKAEHSTIEPVGRKQMGLSVRVGQYKWNSGADQSEAGSTAEVIVATGHNAQVGDSIHFQSATATAALQDLDVTVREVIDANSFRVGEVLPAIPNLDDFDILKPRTPIVNQDGTVSTSSGPISFNRDTGGGPVVTQVLEDTVTPANNRPLPVKLTGFDGDVSIDATNLNLEVQLRHDSASTVDYDSVRLGDGTDLATWHDLDGTGAAEKNLGVSLRKTNAAGASFEYGDDSNPFNIKYTDGTGTAVIGGAGTDSLKVFTDSDDSSVRVNSIGDGTDDVNLYDVDGTATVENTLGVNLRHTNPAGGSFEAGTQTNPFGAEIGDGINQAAIGGAGTDSLKTFTVGTDSSTQIGDGTDNANLYDLDGTATIENVLGVNLRKTNAAGAAVEIGTDADPVNIKYTDGTGTAAIGGSGNDALIVVTDSDSVMRVSSIGDGTDDVTLYDVDGTATVENTLGVSLRRLNPAGASIEPGTDTAPFGVEIGDGTNQASIGGTGSDSLKVFTDDADSSVRVAAIGDGTDNANLYDMDGTATVENVLGVSLRGSNAAGASIEIGTDTNPIKVSTGNTVVDFLDDLGDGPVIDTANDNIPASGAAGGAAALSVVASTASDISKIQVMDTTGEYIGWYDAAVPANFSANLLFISGPGHDQTQDVSIPSGTTIYARAMRNTAISIGDLAINFMG